MEGKHLEKGCLRKDRGGVRLDREGALSECQIDREEKCHDVWFWLHFFTSQLTSL